VLLYELVQTLQAIIKELSAFTKCPTFPYYSVGSKRFQDLGVLQNNYHKNLEPYGTLIGDMNTLSRVTLAVH